MRTIRASLTIATLMLLGACTGLEPRRAGGESDPVALLESQVRLPQDVGKLRIINRHVYDDPAAGVQYRYAGELVYYIDVFVYPVPKALNALLIESREQELVSGEYGRFREELEYAVEQGWYQAVTPVDEGLAHWEHNFTVNDERMSVPFLVAQGRFDIDKQDDRFASFVALSEFNGYFVKARLTYPDYPGLAREMADFTERLFIALYGSNEQLPVISIGSGDNKTDAMCLPGESMLECLGRAMRSVLPAGDSLEPESRR